MPYIDIMKTQIDSTTFSNLFCNSTKLERSNISRTNAATFLDL